ncbi:MAG: prepilin peptidase [Phenylobacterium sp.]|uniref:A24 family peptidase n=1 Tax=Phenylobacterium sp. TaxID=1871053 RepID=UPI002735DA98|nr:prepilin peptidase [Phenylobacterium sp.]MDP3175225.1 prepilin peptidase [Phenylobacterium sp.]
MKAIALALVAAYVAALVLAMVSDILFRRIPNWAVVALIAVFAAVVSAGLSPHPLWASLAAAGISLAAGFTLFAFNVIGAGDAKLFAATALFAGLQNLGALALATVLIGGLMAVVVLVVRPKRALAGLTKRGRETGAGGIPYGVPIACAALLASWTSGFLQSWT